MICKKCGKEISQDSTFCPFCGTKIDREYFNEVDSPEPLSARAAKDESTDTSNNNSSEDISYVSNYDPNRNNNNPNYGSNDTGLSTGAIIAIILGCVIGFLLIIILPLALFFNFSHKIVDRAHDDVLRRTELLENTLEGIDPSDIDVDDIEDIEIDPEVEDYFRNTVQRRR